MARKQTSQRKLQEENKRLRQKNRSLAKNVAKLAQGLERALEALSELSQTYQQGNGLQGRNDDKERHSMCNKAIYNLAGSKQKATARKRRARERAKSREVVTEETTTKETAIEGPLCEESTSSVTMTRETMAEEATTEDTTTEDTTTEDTTIEDTTTEDTMTSRDGIATEATVTSATLLAATITKANATTATTPKSQANNHRRADNFNRNLPKSHEDWKKKRGNVGLCDRQDLVSAFSLLTDFFLAEPDKLFEPAPSCLEPGNSKLLDEISNRAKELRKGRDFCSQLLKYLTALYFACSKVGLYTDELDLKETEDRERGFIKMIGGNAKPQSVRNLRTQAIPWVCKEMQRLRRLGLEYRSWECFLVCGQSMFSYCKFASAGLELKGLPECEVNEDEGQALVCFDLVFLTMIVSQGRFSLEQVNRALGTFLEDETFEEWCGNLCKAFCLAGWAKPTPSTTPGENKRVDRNKYPNFAWALELCYAYRAKARRGDNTLDQDPLSCPVNEPSQAVGSQLVSKRRRLDGVSPPKSSLIASDEGDDVVQETDSNTHNIGNMNANQEVRQTSEGWTSTQDNIPNQSEIEHTLAEASPGLASSCSSSAAPPGDEAEHDERARASLSEADDAEAAIPLRKRKRTSNCQELNSQSSGKRYDLRAATREAQDIPPCSIEINEARSASRSSATVATHHAAKNRELPQNDDRAYMTPSSADSVTMSWQRSELQPPDENERETLATRGTFREPTKQSFYVNPKDLQTQAPNEKAREPRDSPAVEPDLDAFQQLSSGGGLEPDSDCNSSVGTNFHPTEGNELEVSPGNENSDDDDDGLSSPYLTAFAETGETDLQCGEANSLACNRRHLEIRSLANDNLAIDLEVCLATGDDISNLPSMCIDKAHLDVEEFRAYYKTD